MEVIAVEPERKAAQELRAKSTSFRKYDVREIAIAGKNGTGELFVTEHPSMSSLLEPDSAEFTRGFGEARNANEWKRSMNVVQRQAVQTITLNDLCSEVSASFVDFLKIDTQGNELDILKSGESLIRQQRIGVMCLEAALFPVYKGQCYFSDIDLWLRARGYRLVEFRTYPGTSEREDEFAAGKKIYERPRVAPVGDAWYVADRVDDTDLRSRCAVVLAAEGYLSESVHLLTGILNSEEQNTLFRELADHSGRSSVKHFLKRWIPLAIQQWNAKRKKR